MGVASGPGNFSWEVYTYSRSNYEPFVIGKAVKVYPPYHGNATIVVPEHAQYFLNIRIQLQLLNKQLLNSRF